MRTVVKRSIIVLLMIPLLPFGLIAGFGRFQRGYLFSAQACALIPGVVGDYARTAFYVMTLRECSLDARISFGSFCAHPATSLKAGSFVGEYCVLGRVTLGERSTLASLVQVLSGDQQHPRGDDGRFIPGGDLFREVIIGTDCWIGASAIIMADLGDAVTVGAGSIVGTPVPAGMVASGNPARVIRPSKPKSPSSVPSASSGSPI